jgi:Flp pilus assembly pilin Flp
MACDMQRLAAVVGWFRARPERDERGGNLVEYGLLVSLIAVFCMLAIAGFGGSVNGVLGNILAQLP